MRRVWCIKWQRKDASIVLAAIARDFALGSVSCENFQKQKSFYCPQYRRPVSFKRLRDLIFRTNESVR